MPLPAAQSALLTPGGHRTDTVRKTSGDPGDVPMHGYAIKGDAVFAYGVEVGTLLRVETAGMSNTIVYLRSARRGR